MTLAIRQPASDIVPFGEMFSQAQVLVRSGFLPVKSPEAAVAVMLKGKEVGFAAMESFELITVIQGRATISPKGQLVQIYRSGLLESIDIKDDGTTCTVTMARKGGGRHTSSWSMEDARSAGLLSNDNWRKYPKQMRQWRAVGYCADVLFPDIIGATYRPEEFGATVDAEGRVVSVPSTAPTTVEVEVVIEATPEPPASVSLETRKQIIDLLTSRGLQGPEAVAWLSSTIGRTIHKSSELTREEGEHCLAAMASKTVEQPPHDPRTGEVLNMVSPDAPDVLELKALLKSMGHGSNTAMAFLGEMTGRTISGMGKLTVEDCRAAIDLLKAYKARLADLNYHDEAPEERDKFLSSLLKRPMTSPVTLAEVKHVIAKIEEICSPAQAPAPSATAAGDDWS